MSRHPTVRVSTTPPPPLAGAPPTATTAPPRDSHAVPAPSILSLRPASPRTAIQVNPTTSPAHSSPPHSRPVLPTRRPPADGPLLDPPPAGSSASPIQHHTKTQKRNPIMNVTPAIPTAASAADLDRIVDEHLAAELRADLPAVLATMPLMSATMSSAHLRRRSASVRSPSSTKGCGPVCTSKRCVRCDDCGAPTHRRRGARVASAVGNPFADARQWPTHPVPPRACLRDHRRRDQPEYRRPRHACDHGATGLTAFAPVLSVRLRRQHARDACGTAGQ